MSEEELKELKLLIEEYEVCYKESKYEGNAEEYENLKETHKLLKDTLNYIDKLQEKIILISEICIDESKCHISTKDAIEKIRRVI